MKGPFVRLVWIIVCSLLTIMGAGWGVRYDWPDFVHVDYGFPAKWATHTLITFTGPSDRWIVDPTMLLIDVAVWQTILIIGIIILELKVLKK